MLLLCVRNSGHIFNRKSFYMDPIEKKDLPTPPPAAGSTAYSSSLSPNDLIFLQYCDEHESVIRESKMEKLSPENKEKSLQVEKILDRWEALFVHFKAATTQKQRSSIKDQIQAQVIDTLKPFEKDGVDLLFVNSTIDRLSDAEFIFNKENTINRFVNTILYKERVANFLNENRAQILNEFYPNYKDTHTIKFYPVWPSIDLQPETHNGGQFPICVELQDEKDSTVGKLMLKPRDALIDREVINVFRTINALSSKQKSISAGPKETEHQYNLPTYKILSFPEKQMSVWEFIEGSQAKKGTVANYIKDLSYKKCPAKEILVQKLKRMDVILQAMYISDLHYENVIIKGENTDNPQVVPVDCENRQTQEGVKTQLGVRWENNEKIELTSEEKEVIRNFNNQIATIPFRHLLIGTRQLAGFITTHENANSLIETIKDEIDINKFTFIDSDMSKLQRKVLSDIVSGNVPYFTELGDKLYYGFVDKDNVIGYRL